MFGIRTQQVDEAGWTAISRDPPVYAAGSLSLSPPPPHPCFGF